MCLFFPVVILFLFLSKQVAFPHVVGYFTTQNYWIDYMQTDSYRRFWYIAAIFFFYFISPILFQIINEIGKSFKKVLIFKSKNTICFYNSFVFSFDCIVFAC